MHLDIRQVSSPEETKTFDTTQLRDHYLMPDLFQSGAVKMTYSHLDRTVVGGAMPDKTPLTLESHKQIGTPNFLDRREIGIINIGDAGTVTADGTVYTLASDGFCNDLDCACDLFRYHPASGQDPAQIG